MIVKKYILITLDDLDRLYNESSTTFEATYYSKLAVIETCGWIEITMDNIVNSYINRKIKTVPFIKMCNSVVKKNFGFRYEENFRKMLIQMIGIGQMEEIEKKLNKNTSGIIDILIAELDILKDHRNDASHTYINATKVYPAPSSTKGQLIKIYPILKKIHAEIKSIN